METSRKRGRSWVALGMVALVAGVGAALLAVSAPWPFVAALAVLALFPGWLVWQSWTVPTLEERYAGHIDAPEAKGAKPARREGGQLRPRHP